MTQELPQVMTHEEIERFVSKAMAFQMDASVAMAEMLERIVRLETLVARVRWVLDGEEAKQ